MNGFALGAISLAGVLAVIYLAFVNKPPSKLRSFVKTASVAILAFAALTTDTHLWLPLALCALGDYFLSDDGDDNFLYGLIAFACGHLAYVVIFTTHPDWNAALIDFSISNFNPFLWAPILLSVVALFLIVPYAAGLRAAVLIYISIILAMILSAIGLTKGNPLALVYLGAAIFAVSDFILAIDRFRLNGTSQMASYAVWLTYWPAQLLILLAFL